MVTINWLLEADPWVEYRARLDLLGEQADSAEVLRAREGMLAHPLIKRLLSELQEWPGEAFSSHKSAGLMMHKLSFLAEAGLKDDVSEISSIIQRMLKHTDEGVPQFRGNIPKHYGGSGKDTFGWSLCDAPLALYSLLSFDEANVTARKGLKKLKILARDNGWPCAVSPELGSFRGPGKKGDPCPYATLIMLKALSAAGETECAEASAGVECLLHLWRHSSEEHPYIFYMGTDFRKLKAPFVWYDILHVADVLSRFDTAKGDKRLHEMAGIINAKAGNDGTFTPESVWKAWSDFEFGQKKQPSAWLTLLALRIQKRLGR